MALNDEREDLRSDYGFFLFLPEGFSENSSQPRTMKPIATPVIANQVPSLSIRLNQPTMYVQTTR